MALLPVFVLVGLTFVLLLMASNGQGAVMSGETKIKIELLLLVAVGSGGAGQLFRSSSEPTDPHRYSRRHFIACKFYPPSKPLLLKPLSSERHRRPSCCRQQQAGPRRFHISWSRYPGPSRMMAAPGRSSWEFAQMRVQRMRRWRPSLRESSSWCSPIVVRPTSDEERIESADNRSCHDGFVFGAPLT